MRYIGNKTRLLGFIADTLRRLGIAPGSAVDPFTGTASVARALKRHGWRVLAGDLMEYGYVFARAYVEVPTHPRLPGLAAVLNTRRPTLAAAVRHLESLPPEPGFMARNFAPPGDEADPNERCYFTAANAGRIDAIRRTLHDWRRAQFIDDDAFHILLASLLEGADAVANTTGVYAAWVKEWQPNALRPLSLRTTPVLRGNGCHAARTDALALVRGAGEFDLLYLDPPYNERQYPGYYHLPELIALGWFDGEPDLRGKTGLIPDAHKRSDWSRRNRCETAFETLVGNARCKHILLSYNTEGIIPERTIEDVLRGWGRADTFRRFTHRYRRYRADADGAKRRYRTDAVHEILFYAQARD